MTERIAQLTLDAIEKRLNHLEKNYLLESDTGGTNNVTIVIEITNTAKTLMHQMKDWIERVNELEAERDELKRKLELLQLGRCNHRYSTNRDKCEFCGQDVK